jgi:DNA-binding response OmpR family regulator
MKMRESVYLSPDSRLPPSSLKGFLMARYQPAVLVVDDDPDVCQNMSDVLSDHGFRVDSALEARSALRLMEQNCYDITLLNLRIPNIDGLALCHEITRRHPKTAAFLITGYPEDVQPAQALAAGIRLTFAKPIHVYRLLAEIKQTLVG